MKRGRPLQRRTPLRAKTPWRPKRKPLRPVSDKRRVENRERRKGQEDFYTEHLWCERCGRPFGDYCQPDTHEHLSRARGGSITDPANWKALCRECHDLVTREPDWAEKNGWALKTGEQTA